jgi:phage terminase Nu1 subunit (DNA packaging protein)
VKKQEEKEAAEKKAEIIMDKFNMTPAQKEKAAMKKMEEANKHIAAALGIDFEEFDD